LKNNQRFLLYYGALTESVFRFFSARQVSEIILNESSKNTQNALIERLFSILEIQMADKSKWRIFLQIF
jgi:hypothetical protein